MSTLGEQLKGIAVQRKAAIKVDKDDAMRAECEQYFEEELTRLFSIAANKGLMSISFTSTDKVYKYVDKRLVYMRAVCASQNISLTQGIESPDVRCGGPSHAWMKFQWL
jgi:hypothetical protein